jgi:glycerol-3-phosphate dehydrogenase
MYGAANTIQARAVVNATGPFSDAFDRGRHHLRPTLGVHLVLDERRLPHGGRATVLRSPRDGRLVFLLPAGARSLVGTTDTDWTPADAGGAGTGPPRPGDVIAARPADVEYLLEVANHAFPALALGPDDVVSTFAGLRPLVAADRRTVSATSREHDIIVERDGVVTVVGGKLTTYRRMAEQVVDRTVELLRDYGFAGAVAPSATETRPLPGGGPQAATLGPVELAADVELHLRGAYGGRAPAVVTEMSGRSVRVDLAARIDPGLPYVWAELAYAARHELVTEVEDVLRRRVPVYRDARDQGLSVAARATDVVGDVLGWSKDRRVRSLHAYREAVTASRAWNV